MFYIGKPQPWHVNNYYMNPIVLRAKIIFYRIFANPTFIIKIENGIVTKAAGIVRTGYLKDCADIVKESGLKEGLIYAAKGQYGVLVIKGSGKISQETLQKFRNAWSFAS